MPTPKLDPRVRLEYLARRVRGFDAGSVVRRARETATAHRKWTPAVVVDMLFSAAFRDVAFQDYVDYDFAILTRAERATFMTHSISNHLAMTHDAPRHRSLFHDKVEFNRAFDAFLGREWLDIRTASVDEVRGFVERHGRVMGKVPVSDSGHGVQRYEASDIDDWTVFRDELLRKDQVLLEEYLTQHPVLAEVCPGTINTTRVTTFFDGRDVHVLSMAQKFGRGQASDQQTFGGFYTMLDERGHSRGPGYDSHDGVHLVHPESKVSIPDFQLPDIEEVHAFLDGVGRVVPDMKYVGWDIVVGDGRIFLVEGNWAAGVYENKPSVTGIRTGSLPRFREAIGF